MKIPAHAPLHLLHQTAVGTLATHAREPEGYPYPSILPFAPDAQHRPTILVSRLAEHTRNLLIDPRAGFLVAHAPDGDVLNGARATLLGRFAPVEATPDFVRRYLRYQPDAERYLALGDFTFWTLQLDKLRYIGGFGAMGWLDAADLDPFDPLSPEDENALIDASADRLADRLNKGDALRVLGLDHYGVDLLVDGARTRYVFDGERTGLESLASALDDCIARHLQP